MAKTNKRIVKKKSPTPTPSPTSSKKRTVEANVEKYKNRSKVQKDIDSAWEVFGEPGNPQGRKIAKKFLESYGYDVKSSLKSGKPVKSWR